MTTPGSLGRDGQRARVVTGSCPSQWIVTSRKASPAWRSNELVKQRNLACIKENDTVAITKNPPVQTIVGEIWVVRMHGSLLPREHEPYSLLYETETMVLHLGEKKCSKLCMKAKMTKINEAY